MSVSSDGTTGIYIFFRELYITQYVSDLELMASQSFKVLCMCFISQRNLTDELFPSFEIIILSYRAPRAQRTKPIESLFIVFNQPLRNTVRGKNIS